MQHLPVFVGVDAKMQNASCWLVQDGFITLYSTDTKLPLFTAEKLEWTNLNTKVIVKNNITIIIFMTVTIVLY